MFPILFLRRSGLSITWMTPPDNDWTPRDIHAIDVGQRIGQARTRLNAVAGEEERGQRKNIWMDGQRGGKTGRVEGAIEKETAMEQNPRPRSSGQRDRKLSRRPGSEVFET